MLIFTRSQSLRYIQELKTRNYPHSWLHHQFFLFNISFPSAKKKTFLLSQRKTKTNKKTLYWTHGTISLASVTDNFLERAFYTHRFQVFFISLLKLTFHSIETVLFKIAKPIVQFTDLISLHISVSFNPAVYPFFTWLSGHYALLDFLFPL